MSVDPITRQELYMRYMAGDTTISLPEPVTRLEKYWYKICMNGIGGSPTAKSVSYDDSKTELEAGNVQEAIDKLSEQIVNKTASIYIGSTQPTDGTLYWLDTSEDETEEPDTPIEPEDPEVTLTSISATYSGGEVAVGTAVSDLTGITVTGTYSDGSTATITDYTLSGEIVEGSNTITVTYGGLITTITVTGVAESGGGTVTVEIPDVAEETQVGYRATGPGIDSPTLQEIEGQTAYKITNVKAGDVITTVHVNASDSVVWINGVGVVKNSDSRVTAGSFVDNYAGRMYTVVADADYETVWVNAIAKCVTTGRVTWTKSV